MWLYQLICSKIAFSNAWRCAAHPRLHTDIYRKSAAQFLFRSWGLMPITRPLQPISICCIASVPAIVRLRLGIHGLGAFLLLAACTGNTKQEHCCLISQAVSTRCIRASMMMMQMTYYNSADVKLLLDSWATGGDQSYYMICNTPLTAFPRKLCTYIFWLNLFLLQRWLQSS